MPFDPNLFRQVLGRFVTGVTVVTTHHSGTKHGMTANAFSSVSLDPPLILVSVDKKANMHELLTTVDVFCVNILAEHRPEWSSWWAGKAPKEGDQFAEIPHLSKATGCPVLDECLAYIDCKVWARFDVGQAFIQHRTARRLAQVWDLGKLVALLGCLASPPGGPLWPVLGQNVDAEH